MREIKFRAWDKDNVRFLELFDITRFSDGTVGVSDSSPPFNKYGEVQLQQYTGLKDKNGVEIYEGDWVELKTPNKLPSFLSKRPDIDGKYVVTWGYAGFQYEREPRGLGIMNDTLDCGSHPHEIQIEVIGNIYENKDF